MYLESRADMYASYVYQERDKKYMLPPREVRRPRVGPEYQAQIPQLQPQPLRPTKRSANTEPLDDPVKRSHL